MQIASLNLESSIFNINFVKKSKDKNLYKLLRDDENLYAYFEIHGSKKYFSQITYPLKNLNSDIQIIKNEMTVQIIQTLIITLILSVLFSLYTLYPLKKSLQMTNEFIKDILHDFNTPISTIRLNSDLLKDTNTKAVTRIRSGVDTILNLQNNLKNYIDDELGESEEFDINELIQERLKLLVATCPYLKFKTNVPKKIIYTYKDGMIRILDNILSNACKYNKQNGKVFISLENNILEIRDTGIGIKNPKKVFDRFYKESSRGLGIGLHIVDKLSKKMSIPIEIDSKINKGTVFKLDLSQLNHYVLSVHSG
jgi:signal transduction histidine kinase